MSPKLFAIEFMQRGRNFLLFHAGKSSRAL
jgi:hypothetical protein